MIHTFRGFSPWSDGSTAQTPWQKGVVKQRGLYIGDQEAKQGNSEDDHTDLTSSTPVSNKMAAMGERLSGSQHHTLFSCTLQWACIQ